MFSKSVFIFSAILIGGIFVSILIAPFLSTSFQLANDEPFTELWLLGPEHVAENYPYNITSNQDYAIYLGVCNQLNEAAEYSIRIKLCDSNFQLPNSSSGEFSSSPSVEQFDFNLSYDETWEQRVNFEINYDLVQQNLTQIESININGKTFSLNQNLPLVSNQDSFNVILVFELWSKTGSDNTFEYSNQYLQLILKLENDGLGFFD